MASWRRPPAPHRAISTKEEESGSTKKNESSIVNKGIGSTKDSLGADINTIIASIETHVRANGPGAMLKKDRPSITRKQLGPREGSLGEDVASITAMIESGKLAIRPGATLREKGEVAAAIRENHPRTESSAGGAIDLSLAMKSMTVDTEGTQENSLNVGMKEPGQTKDSLDMSITFTDAKATS